MKLSISAAALVACLATPLTSALGLVVSNAEKLTSDYITPWYSPPKNPNTLCDRTSRTTAGKYYVYNRIENSKSDKMGTQCTNITAINGDTIDFQSSFTVEPYDSVVKSMSIVQYSFKSIALSNINSIPSKMKFTIRHDDKTVLFVAYTLNLWSQAGKSFGVSLYLETVGNVVIPSNYSKLREVTVLGIECNVFSGQNKFNVDEFIIVAKKVDRDLEIDLKPFLNMLQQWTEIRSDFLLSDVSLTTQIIGGSGRVTVNHLSISVNARNM